MPLNNSEFEDSYARLFGSGVGISEEGSEFFDSFYQKFLQNPNIADLFTGVDMAGQIQMLRRSLFQLVTFYVTGEPTAELERIAGVHSKLKIQPGMFDDWLQALVDTVIEIDTEANETTQLAWAWALSPGITYMRLAIDGRLKY